ncbi:TrmB family transcriptional regulator [Labilibacter marinus]|uniref:TrmB family transcriptional regulator n=1 Tax=Labilibacter marinus TaxID=1477105 RepID=UPI0008330B75|nr:helix-turn-helix domain-containing protein [Labilibacter marinus]
MKSNNTLYQDLLDIGFNLLEAEVYIGLLTTEPMTAYGIAKHLNKPAANVYKAMDTLAQKGAVIIEDNTKRICKAVLPDEFIGHYEKSLIRKMTKVKSQLRNLGKTHFDERSYSINSTDLAFEKFCSMMDQCKQIAIIDIFPEPFKRVKSSIIDAIKRGVKVHIQVYDPVELPGAEIAYTSMASNVLEYWQSQQMNVIIDGEQHLLSLMNNATTEILQAKWSNNLYESNMLLAGFSREQVVIKLLSHINDNDFCAKAKEILNNEKFFFNSEIPGVKKLFELYSRK